MLCIRNASKTTNDSAKEGVNERDGAAKKKGNNTRKELFFPLLNFDGLIYPGLPATTLPLSTCVYFRFRWAQLMSRMRTAANREGSASAVATVETKPTSVGRLRTAADGQIDG